MAKSRPIDTGRLRILPFLPEYVTSRYISWLNDPDVVRYSEQRHKEHTLDSVESYMRAFENSPNYFWAIFTKQHLCHIGNLTATIDPANLVADLAIMIGEKMAWSKGFGSEAFTAVSQYLLDEVGMRKVTAGTLAENKSMIRLAEKAQMIKDGMRSEHMLFEDRPVDLIYFAKFR